MVTERTLWLDGSQTRFFLIPDDQTLPPGELTLRTLLLRHQRVDEATAALYEVTQDAANEHLKGQFARAGNALKDSISALAARMAEPTGAEATDGAQGTDDAAEAAPVVGEGAQEAQPEAQSARREQSEAAQAQIRRGAELLEEGVRTFLSGLKDAFKDALDQIPIGAKGSQAAAAPADAAAAATPAPAQAAPATEAPGAASAPASAPAEDEPAAR